MHERDKAATADDGDAPTDRGGRGEPIDDWQPDAAEARRRLDALSAPMRSRVQRAARSRRHGVEDPTLAAAVVAHAERHRVVARRWVIGLAVLSAGILVAGAIGTGELVLLWFVPVLGAVVAFSWWVRLGFGLGGSIERHREVLADHGSVPPPGPVDDPELAADERRTTRRAAMVAAVAGVCLVGFAGWQYVEGARVADRLRDAGEASEATVVGTDYRRRAPDLLEVSFRAEGAERSAKVFEVGDDLGEGDTLAVVYDPADPGVVRPEGHLDGDPWYWAIWGLAGIVIPVAAWVRLRRVSR